MSNEVLAPDIDTIKAVIHTLSERLETCYVFPDIAQQVSDHLKKSLDSGEYTNMDSGELFALALTIHMQEVCHDEHLWVRWHAEPLPDFEGQLRLDKEWKEQQRLAASLDNFGLYKMERLPGNIGTMDLRYFHRAAWSADALTAAMRLVENTQALIIDLRKCTGGYPDMIALVCSYFFDGPPIHLSSIYWRDEDLTQEFWTTVDLPGKQFLGKPVYILVSRQTFSGGEGFASIMQTRKRATVIGEKTDGGAHPGTSYRIHPHYEAFIPIGRGFDPLTGKDLEGKGVLPDMHVPHEHAFPAAYHLALKGVLDSAENSLSKPAMDIVKEADLAIKEQNQKHKFCPKCGYQNPLLFKKCKNCDEPLPG